MLVFSLAACFLITAAGGWPLWAVLPAVVGVKVQDCTQKTDLAELGPCASGRLIPYLLSPFGRLRRRERVAACLLFSRNTAPGAMRQGRRLSRWLGAAARFGLLGVIPWFDAGELLPRGAKAVEFLLAHRIFQKIRLF